MFCYSATILTARLHQLGKSFLTQIMFFQLLVQLSQTKRRLGNKTIIFLCTIVQRSQMTSLYAENILIFNKKALSVRGYRTTWPLLSYSVLNVSVWNIFYWPLQVVMQTGRIRVDYNNSQLAQKLVWPLPVAVPSLRTTSKIS